MKITDTRYRGVWSGGHTAATQEAGNTLRNFIAAGGEFSMHGSVSSWDKNTMALRLGVHIMESPPDGLFYAMQFLLERKAGSPLTPIKRGELR